ncbi:MAG: TlpA family protein disulfide reductase [Ardenticatenaceae bacterium]|nr:TlpA family protein disulfide reductase [Ardenticatenaceae bacterium]MCB9005561.1 TlpA family protein disulfide reductase [Ardenticatenaceae bacterium]
MVLGFAVVAIALVFLLFGNNLFDSNSSAALQQVPALDGSPQVEGDGLIPQVGQAAYNFTAQDLEGNTISLSDYRGKPVMINFWATWCPPCRQELPDFEQAYQAYAEDELVILALNQDEPANLVESYFYDENGFSFTPLLDVGSTISRGYGVNSFPTTIFVDADGVVTAVHRGLLVPQQLETYLAQTLPSS